MEEAKKRRFMISVIVVCLLVAGIIYWRTNASRQTDTTSGDVQNGTVLMKCNNQRCQAVFEVTAKEYREFMQQSNPLGEMQLGMQCKQCGQRSAFRAVRCEKCGSVFFYGYEGADFADRCPKCGFSKMESNIKAGQLSGSGGR